MNYTNITLNSDQNETSLYKLVVIINVEHKYCYERAIVCYIDKNLVKVKLIDHDIYISGLSWSELAWLAKDFCSKPSECYSVVVDGVAFPADMPDASGTAMQITNSFFKPDNQIDATFSGAFFYNRNESIKRTTVVILRM